MASVALLRSWGINPSVCVGHSVGEVAASVVAGCFSLEEGVRVIHSRSRLQHQAARYGGKMMAINVDYETGKKLVSKYQPLVPVGEGHGLCIRSESKKRQLMYTEDEKDEGRKEGNSFLIFIQYITFFHHRWGVVNVPLHFLFLLCFSAWTSPSQITVSGDGELIELMCKDLAAQSIRCKVLNVAAAFHSPHMQFLEAELKQSLSSLSDSNTVITQAQARESHHIQWISTVEPGQKDSLKADANYWYDVESFVTL